MTVTADLTFPATSRYHGIGTAKRTLPDGREVAYLKRRFLPPPDRFAVIAEHRVEEGERMDLIAARYLSDPLQFWRICDANAAMHPDDLTAPDRVGTRLRITLPEGVPGMADAPG
ncbi:MAG: LysM domain-containing protein [Chromatiales bacterium]|jgi:hypothetical protein